jgi:hypothetical protein
MFEEYGLTREVNLVLGLAEVLREEFGVAIDAQPGGAGSVAGPINRAFLASARLILKAIVPPSANLPDLTTWVMRCAARRRLSGFGMPEGKVEAVLDSEPALGDPWLAYLALSPDSVIEDVVAGRGKAG